MSDSFSRTESVNPATKGLDVLATADLVGTLFREQQSAVGCIGPALPAVTRAVDEIARAIAGGGSLHYVGAGTSGRLGVLDAAECPPTFSTPPELVQAHIAGGAAAFLRAVEGAEDDALAGTALAEERVRPGDAVVGISAGGTAAYVVAALQRARERGAFTIALTAGADSPLARVAGLAIVIDSGPEALAGSTRLGAGTVQKIVLSTISTAVMVRLGHVYDNLMVDVTATNAKLRRRAVGLVRELGGGDDLQAQTMLDRAGGNVKVAVVMQRLGLDAAQARSRLAGANGSLRAALGER